MTAEIIDRLNNIRFWVGQDPMDPTESIAKKWKEATAEYPKKRRRLHEKCSECGARLSGQARRFCSRDCAKAWHKRMRDRAVQFLNLYMETRKNRNGKYNIGHANSMIASWFAEDYAMGREPHHPELIPPISRITLSKEWE
jgi:hypothetical protein